MAAWIAAGEYLLCNQLQSADSNIEVGCQCCSSGVVASALRHRLALGLALEFMTRWFPHIYYIYIYYINAFEFVYDNTVVAATCHRVVAAAAAASSNTFYVACAAAFGVVALFFASIFNTLLYMYVCMYVTALPMGAHELQPCGAAFLFTAQHVLFAVCRVGCW